VGPDAVSGRGIMDGILPNDFAGLGDRPGIPSRLLSRMPTISGSLCRVPRFAAFRYLESWAAHYVQRKKTPAATDQPTLF